MNADSPQLGSPASQWVSAATKGCYSVWVPQHLFFVKLLVLGECHRSGCVGSVVPKDSPR